MINRPNDKTFTRTKNALTLPHELLHFNENGKHSLRNSTVTVYLGGSKLSCYSIIRKVPTSQVFLSLPDDLLRHTLFILSCELFIYHF